MRPVELEVFIVQFCTVYVVSPIPDVTPPWAADRLKTVSIVR